MSLMGVRKSSVLYKPVAASAGATITFVGNSSATALIQTATENTFTAHVAGSAASGDILVIGVGYETAQTVNSVTVGGNAATLILHETGSSHVGSDLWYVTGITTGATEDIVVTFASATNKVAIAVWKISDAGTTTPYASASSSVPSGDSTDTIDVPAGGVQVGFAAHRTGAQTLGSPTGWASYSVDGSNPASSFYVAGGEYTNETGSLESAKTFTVNWSASQYAAIVLASWE